MKVQYSSRHYNDREELGNIRFVFVEMFVLQYIDWATPGIHLVIDCDDDVVKISHCLLVDYITP